ncbi:hypothetical protein ZOSMA_51G00430 [Zostera marina]|uniref:PHD-type domain-containing protein n=1 Tax=Zostera marina TaxID=29655 RepID=A0A0K9NZZ1_ZOSMR|nr:hypothetical protein ZOSMA_51G00430 [Zostera marina]
MVKKFRNRRDHAATQNFSSFPSEEVSAKFTGPFRTNINEFITQFAPIVSNPRIGINLVSKPGFLKCKIPFNVSLRNEEHVDINMYILEKSPANSNSPLCRDCQVVGWSKHPVCKKRYHFIIPNHQPTISKKRSRKETREEDTKHLLHGLIHSNGYGHLVRINGIQGGSKNLSGSEIVSFWDRLCKLLRVRQISVMDVSKKYGVAYRSLHAITKGFPWYGLWGYDFGKGGFNVTKDEYRKAIDIISGKPMSYFFSLFSRCSSSERSRLLNVISFYRDFSDKKLSTVRDLFCVVLDLIHKAKKRDSREEEEDEEESPLSSNNFTEKDKRTVEATILKIFMLVDECRSIKYQDLKKALYRTASPDIIDYCLKRLKQTVLEDGSVVASLYNDDTHSIEFRRCRDQSEFKLIDKRPSLKNLIRDLKFLFDSILDPNTMDERIDTVDYATRILDCKVFIKDYGNQRTHYINVEEDAEKLRICCNLEHSCKTKNLYLKPQPPSELLVLHNTATIRDLKLAALNAFQNVYIALKGLRIESLVDHEYINDSVHVRLFLGNNATVTVTGKCPVNYGGLSKFIMEGGKMNWIVDCFCGVKDDDGEKMIACDSCNVWKHTRCLSLDDDQIFDSPIKFVCPTCDSTNNTRSILTSV